MDLIKRLCIVLGIMAFLGVLFFSTSYTFAAEDRGVPYEWEEAFIWPTVGELTDTFGTRGGSHYGIDIAAEEGTPVVSVADGVVSRSYYSDTYGNVIFINHDNQMETVYAHLHERLVKEEQYVEEGQLIGTVGTTGRSSGNHLHFEVHQESWNVHKSEAIDPLFVLSQKPSHMYASLEAERNDAISAAARNEEVSSNVVGKITVTKGDTLWSLAQRYGVSVELIKEWNHLKDETIYINQQLMIYEVSTVHNVQKGETLTAIANQYERSVDDVMELNKLDSDQILIGQMLYIERE
ncbi:peptidoglycan DD-metalloendopeptidase family protein [Halalkalibacter sp. AB-rgal2]|uniref:peptidoglycan DD-metalloendopeptidase family protein n=1 Tax=Halalkalibacter sp. AB-rgal2 TaxID=3242695 RepID=UPI00359DEF34